MSPDQPLPPRSEAHAAERLRRRGLGIVALFAVFAVVLLGVGSWLLADSQSKDRQNLRDRYAVGAEIAADTLNGLFGAAIGPSLPRYSQLYSGPVPTAEMEAFAKQQQALYLALLDQSGRVIAATSRAPADAGSQLVGRFDAKHLFVLGDVRRDTGQPVLESAIRFPTGRTTARILVSGSSLKVFGPFLSGAVSKLVRFGGEAYVVDGHGQVLGAVSAKHPKRPPPPSPELIKQIATHETGFYDRDGKEQFFSAQPVSSSDWHVAVSAPTDELYQPASGVSRWLPWVVLAILALALVAIGVLVRRAVEAGARIAGINSQLEASQDRLRDRAIELQASNAELQRSNAELEQFAYVASHDLSAPLRAVAGFSQLLGVRYQGKLDDDADEFIKHMQDGVDRMQRIIDDLLAYSRVDRSGLQPEELDLDKMLDEVLQGLRPDIEERGAEVTREPLGRACGEPGQLSQVLQNLIANGIKFTAPGVAPRVHVSAQRADDRVRVSVRDNGIGVDPAHIEQIFKMFQRLHGADEYEGTGIGLAIAKKIIDRHDGRIDIEPEPGGGTVFSFDIPAEMPR
jgi:signal transduction histidine kinase